MLRYHVDGHTFGRPISKVRLSHMRITLYYGRMCSVVLNGFISSASTLACASLAHAKVGVDEM